MVTYNPGEPPHRQEEDWDCSQESAEWALCAVGRHPSDDWMEATMRAEGVVNPAVGLTDASGKGLAAFLTRHYGEFGYWATNDAATTFDKLAEEAGQYPLMIGARNWGGPGLGHWSGLATYDAGRGVLDLRNPATGPRFGHSTLTPDEFTARGPWSMVRLLHRDLMGSPPPPTRAELDAIIAELAGIRDRLPT